jgi:tetratricopeptide (TPR) repeat protein
MTECMTAIVWVTNADAPSEMVYNFLAYGSGGLIRVYQRDHYDARCDLGRNRAKDGPLPYFRSWKDVNRFFLVNPDRTECQVDIRTLRRVFPDLDLAEVDSPRLCDIDSPVRNMVAALAALVLSLFVTSGALAQESPTDHDARVAFESGDLAFSEGRYEDAFDDFTRAYDLSHRPELLYNIGLAADRLRRDEEAIDAFEAYLDALPEATNRPEVQRRLRALHDAVAAEADIEAAIAVPPADPAPPITTSRPIYEEWWLWTLVGCAVVAAVAIPVGIVAGSRTETEPLIPGHVGPGGIVIALEAP